MSDLELAHAHTTCLTLKRRLDEARSVAAQAQAALEYLLDDGDDLHDEPEWIDDEHAGRSAAPPCPQDDTCTCPAVKLYNETHEALRKLAKGEL